MDVKYGFYWIFFVVWILYKVKHSAQTTSISIDKHTGEYHDKTILNAVINGSQLSNRDKREAPSEFTIIKHKSRPSKRHPPHRARRRPKPIYGPPSYNYGSPISDFTFGNTANGRKTIKGQTQSPFSTSILDSNYESDYLSPLKINLYSGHNSYESTFKNNKGYVESSALLPLENYGGETSSSYTVPPSQSYSNQGFKHFAEPPPKSYDLTGFAPVESVQSIKSLPPSTNYGIPVAPIQTIYKNQAQNTPAPYNTAFSNTQPQETYISNLHSSFSTPTNSQSQQFYNLPNLQTNYRNPIYTNPGIYTNPVIYTNPTINTNPAVNGNPSITSNPSVNENPSVNSNSGINTAFVDPTITNLLSKFNQNALNTLTFNSYAPPQTPQVKYIPGSVTITSSKEIVQDGNLSPGKFAEPPKNYKNSYQAPITSYDAPLQYNTPKTTYNIDGPENQFEPTNFKPPQYYWNESRSTTTEKQNYLPPTLPSSYDQNQFNHFLNENEYSSNNNQQSDFIDSDGDYSSLFDVSHESKKIQKTKFTKTYAGTKLKSEDSSVESVEIPSDEYVDELISASTTKKPRTRRRRPKPTAASTTPHVLDTDDLRDAFSSGSVQYSLSINPNEEASKNTRKQQSKISKDRNFVLLSSANTNRTWNRPIPKRNQTSFDPIHNVREFLKTNSESEKSGQTNTSSKGIEILSIQQSKSHSYYAGTVAPQFFKQNGITARYDQPKYDDSMFNVVSTNVRMSNNGNSKFKWAGAGNRRTKKQNFDDSDQQIEDNVRKNEDDPIYWNGRKLPDNHKLAKRIVQIKSEP